MGLCDRVFGHALLGAVAPNPTLWGQPHTPVLTLATLAAGRAVHPKGVCSMTVCKDHGPWEQCRRPCPTRASM